MTSFSWFSGNRESSRKYTVVSPSGMREGPETACSGKAGSVDGKRGARFFDGQIVPFLRGVLCTDPARNDDAFGHVGDRLRQSGGQHAGVPAIPARSILRTAGQ